MNDVLKEYSKKANKDIAIIGMSAKFSQADNIDDFWNNLKHGRDCVTDCPDERKRDIEEYLDYLQVDQNQRFYRKAAFLKEIDKFDYEFFRIPPKEADIMDPHQRLLLEISYHVVEDSGYSVDDFFDKKVGIFTGYPTEYTCKAYQNLIMDTAPELANDSFAGNLPAMLPARLSYFLNLHGPAILIDTSCSSSLTAVHMACGSIHNGDCDLAIVNGINIFTLPIDNQIVNSIGIVAPDGRAKTFDDSCDGVGQGEGAGAIILKPLSKAIRDKDNIYAVIKSSAVNQDGKSIGITAPNVSAQEKVLVEAWIRANIDPDTISYIETHGTATKLGDPTEISGINRAFKNFTSKKQFCGVGSVKSNIGHTIGAAGMASIIKSALSLKNKQIPASIHFKKPNSKIDFVNSSVYVNSRFNQWEGNYPRRCGVSAFGISGTNCHIVLEEAPNIHKRVDHTYQYLLFTISAVSEESLKNLIVNYIRFLDYNHDIDLYNLCYTVNVGRKDLTYRIAIGVSSLSMLKDKLQMLADMTAAHDMFPSEEKSLFLMNQDIWITGYETGIVENKSNVVKSEVIKDSINRAFDKADHMKALGQAYVLGEDIPWKELYKNYEGYKLSIPVYPFKKSRCWFDIPEYNKIALNQSNLYYRPVWEASNITQPLISLDINSSCIVFSNYSLFISELVEKLKIQYTNVILIEYSDHYEKINSNHYLIEDDKKHYKKLYQDLNHCNITHIIYNCFANNNTGINHLEETEMVLNYGIYRFYSLVQVLADIISYKIEVYIITENTYTITSKEKMLNPGYAALIGFTKTINWEIPFLHCQCIDTDNDSPADNIINEISHQSSDFIVSYRDNSRYVERIRQIEWDKIEDCNYTIRDHGTYVLIGGLGRIGRRLCRLFMNKNVNIVIISRSKFIDHTLWEKTYAETEDENLRNQLEHFMDVEKKGSKVHIFSCDISDYEQMKIILERIRNEIGSINGLIQCAVDNCGKQIRDQSIDELKKSLKPKIYGTCILDKLTSEDNLDFFIMFSSVMTLVSGLGTSSYVTANSYLEAFSEYRCHNNRASQVISWSEWLDIGLDQNLMNHEDKSLFTKLPLQTGLNAFLSLLLKKIDRVIVGQVNYKSKIYELIDYLPFKFSEDIKAKIQNKGETITDINIKTKSSVSVKLHGRKTGFYSETEQKIAEAYYCVLGYDNLNITTNFFELGGDSISAVKICVELENHDINLTPVDIMKYQTIQSLAENCS